MVTYRFSSSCFLSWLSWCPVMVSRFEVTSLVLVIVAFLLSIVPQQPPHADAKSAPHLAARASVRAPPQQCVRQTGVAQPEPFCSDGDISGACVVRCDLL